MDIGSGIVPDGYRLDNGVYNIQRRKAGGDRMKPIDYIIIGIVVIVSAVIIIRKVTGKSKSCSCIRKDCAACGKREDKGPDKNDI
jgi:hypothetical protein